jgi:hypothetical protein
MNRLAFAVILFVLLPAAGVADDQVVVDQCIAAWGPKSPFKKGARPEQVIGTGVKVFGLGSSQSGHDAPTDKPSLVLVRTAVNVAGKSTIRLSNPKGWYCFEDAVTVMGKINIVAHCNAHLAGAKGDGTAVMAANDANQGTAVMGALRVTRFGCSGK